MQQRIDTAAPGATLQIEAGAFHEKIVINKPLKLIGSGDGSQIVGDVKGNVVTITADDVTLSGFRVAGSGLRLMDDDAAIFITGNRATISSNVVEDSLHGIYLKKTTGSRVLNNRIHGKTTLSQDATVNPNNLAAGNVENCDTNTALVAARRGNGIHQWNCTGNLLAGNEISDTRDGIYFSFTTKSRAENNTIRRARYGLHYMYSDENVFENNTFADNAGGAAMMFSKKLLIRGNHFIENRGMRAYGLLFQSVDYSRVEENQIEQNAVGLSFIQCNENEIASNRVARNYLGVRFDSNSDGNRFSENQFVKNLHPVETGGEINPSNRWSLRGVGNLWDSAAPLDLDSDGINDLPHRELDLFGALRRDFPGIGLLSESPVVKMLRYAHERAALPGVDSVEDRASLTASFWKIRARRMASQFAATENLPSGVVMQKP